VCDRPRDRNFGGILDGFDGIFPGDFAANGLAAVKEKDKWGYIPPSKYRAGKPPASSGPEKYK
jgi:hypothetical protein